MSRFTRNILILPLALALALGACADDATVTEYGSLSLLLTDGAGDVASAWVTIDRIYLQAAEGKAAGQRVDLLTDEVTVDLITLVEATEGLVEDAIVETGFYEQLRVVVSAACIVVQGEADAEEGPTSAVHATEGFARCGPADGTLQAPRLGGTGIKVLLPADGLQITGERQVLVLDFDARESFGVRAGRSGAWVMSPVIRGSAVEATGAVIARL